MKLGNYTKYTCQKCGKSYTYTPGNSIHKCKYKKFKMIKEKRYVKFLKDRWTNFWFYWTYPDSIVFGQEIFRSRNLRIRRIINLFMIFLVLIAIFLILIK